MPTTYWHLWFFWGDLEFDPEGKLFSVALQSRSVRRRLVVILRAPQATYSHSPVSRRRMEGVA